MITATMTALDIWNCTLRDAEHIKRAVYSEARDLAKEAAKRRVGAVWKCIDYSRNGVKYKVVVYGKRNRTWGWLCHVYMPERNFYIRIVPYCIDGKLHIEKSRTQAYTPHFIRRASERLYHDGVFDINRTLARLNRDITVSKRMLHACLYYDESTGNAVYSFLDGIALGEDRENGYVTFRTFVSYDMLKGSQRRAFDACIGLWATTNEKYGDDSDIAHRMCTDNAFAFAINRELDACKPIYAEFFKNKNK